MNKIPDHIVNERRKFNEDVLQFKNKISEAKIFQNNRRYKLLCKKSKAENHFKKLLLESKIDFVREKIQNGKNSFYYTDFFIKELNICVEIDGPEHESSKDYDLIKEVDIFNSANFLTIRYTNDEVLNLKKIKLKDFNKKLKEKYSKDYLYNWHYKKWQGIRNSEAFKRDLILNNYFDEYLEEINESFKINEINVFIKTNCKSLNEFSNMTLQYLIYDNFSLLDSSNTTTNQHQFVSNHKADIIAINDVLKSLYNNGAKDVSINIFCCNQFIIKKLRSNFLRHNNHEISIYSDCIDETNELIDIFESLKFTWIPKNQHPMYDNKIFEKLNIEYEKN